MKQTITPIVIYTEATPNPASLKFVINQTLLENASVDMQYAEDATQSPFAEMLFNQEGVRSVFISDNFITITKEDSFEWEVLMQPIKEAIKSFLNSEEPVFDADFQPDNNQYSNTAQEGDSELVAKIKNVLETYVTPAVAMDGGSISFVSFDEGVLTLKLQGACSGCPSSMVTLKQGIDSLMKRFVPEVEEIRAEEED